MWEDEEERRFYEDVVDLGEFVPGGILGVKEKKKEEDKEEVKARERKEQEEVKRELEKLEGEGESAAIGGEDHVADNAEYRQDTLPSSPKEEPAILWVTPLSSSHCSICLTDFSLSQPELTGARVCHSSHPLGRGRRRSCRRSSGWTACSPQRHLCRSARNYVQGSPRPARGRLWLLELQGEPKASYQGLSQMFIARPVQ